MSRITSRMSADSQPRSSTGWDGREATSLLVPFSQTPKVFHQIPVSNRTSAAVYLTAPAFGPTILTRNRAFDHNALEIYDVTIGAGGAHIGYVFRSPLRLKRDPYFLLFIRRNADPIEDVIKNPTSAEKRYILEKQVVIHVHDQGFMITRTEDNAVANMLANQ